MKMGWGLLLVWLWPVFTWASEPVLSFKSVECSLFFKEQLLKKQTQDFMTLIVDADLARFAQIQFGDEKEKIQYQILIENNPKTPGSFVVLQNLMVGELESSKEFSTLEIGTVEAFLGDHRVSCLPTQN